MFVPGISAPSSERRKLWRRKGGGGGGRGGGGGGGKSGGSSGSTSGRSAGSISSGGSSKGVSTGSQGTRSVTTIPAGQPFAGRSEGGGMRGDIYGGRAYGSGYPGVTGKGTAGRGFPFFFWPIAFGAGAGGAYHYNSEYGRGDNSSRPGGTQQTTAFISTSPETTFRILSDETTVKSLVESIKENCGNSLSNKDSISLSTYRGADQDPPQPPQIIQYYRSSSIALSLDGYNNTASFSDDENAENTPLPSNINTDLLNCMNTTIGEEAPLVDAALSMASAPSQLALLTIVGFVLAASGVF